MTFRLTRAHALALGLILAVTGFVGHPSGAHAQSRSSRFGIGAMVGEPTGLSMKLRASRGFAVDFGVGFGSFGPGRLQLHADFLGAINLTERSRTGMDLYFGAGPRLALVDNHYGRWNDRTYNGDVWLGVRGAVGLVWEFNRRHLDVFVEAAPTLWIIQGVYFDFGGAVGARYWF